MSDLPAGSPDDQFDEDELEDDEFADWEEVDIGDGTTELMPPEGRYEFRDHVDVIASASGGVGSIGPMTQEHREYICRFGDVYLVRSENDWGYSNTIVGRNVSLEECVERSQAFVIGGGTPVGAWSDEDVDGDIDDEELWDPDEDDDDDPPPVVPARFLCRRVPGHRSPMGRRPYFPATNRFSQSERQEFLETLWSTVITLGDVVIAGEEAVAELPANTNWFVIPCSARERAQLERVLGRVNAVTVEVGGQRFDSALTDRMAATTAARVGEAFGASEIWQLDRDSIRRILVDEPVIVAQALRVR
jgi:hypothetical protein